MDNFYEPTIEEPCEKIRRQYVSLSDTTLDELVKISKVLKNIHYTYETGMKTQGNYSRFTCDNMRQQIQEELQKRYFKK